MKKKVVFILMLCGSLLDAQTLKYNFGQIFYNSKTTTPAISQYEEYTNRNFNLFRYQHTFYKRWNAFLGYSYFEGWTDFSIDRPYDPSIGASWGGNGASYLNVHRLSVGAGYDLLKKNWIYCIPVLTLNIQRSHPTNDAELSDIIDSRTDPEIAGIIYNYPYLTTQIVPELGLEFGVVVFKRIDLGLTISHAFGHKSFQDLTFEYTYRGLPQPTAKWYSDGTAWFSTIGIGFKLF